MERPLAAALERATRQAVLGEAELVKYTYSATGQEIFNGALPGDMSRPEAAPLARHFIDLDPAGQPDPVTRTRLAEIK